MKVIVLTFVVLAVAATLCAARAYPVDDQLVDFHGDRDVIEVNYEETGLLRTRRATCDLLSFEVAGVKVNDSACAAHCLVKRKKGGTCRGGVCRCRN